MTAAAENQRGEFIAQVIERARARLGAGNAVGIIAFLGRYLAPVPMEDLRREPADSLFGAAYAHWRFAAVRPPDRAIIRVYNPRADDDGWQSLHTIIDVICDDMPFIVDSLTAEIARRGPTIHMLLHPVLAVSRDAAGRLVSDDGAVAANGRAESFFHARITRQDDAGLAGLSEGLTRVLDDVRAAVVDWQAMRAALDTAIEEIPESDPDGPPDDEVRAFLAWARDESFTFLGCRRYRFADGLMRFAIEPASGLGILRDETFRVFDDSPTDGSVPAASRAVLERPGRLIIGKSDRLATVHRPALMDIIAVKRVDSDGRPAGADVFIGLFTSLAYTRSVHDMPLLRAKVAAIVAGAGTAPASHAGRALINILETYPRDDLLQATADDLLPTVRGILGLRDRPRPALYLRRDDFRHFVSCLVFVPRDRDTTDVRETVRGLLERTFAGTVAAFFAQVGDGPLARFQVLIKTTAGTPPEVDPVDLEKSVVEAIRTWADRLAEELAAGLGEARGQEMLRLYGPAFPRGYQDHFTADAAVADIHNIERTLAGEVPSLTLYRPIDGPDRQMRLKVFYPERPVILSDALPILEHLGLRVIDEVPFVIGPGDGPAVWIHDFGLERRDGAAIDVARIREPFIEAFLGIWRGEIESDGFNGLVLAAGLTARETVILRAYGRYLRQTGIALSLQYMAATLMANGTVARDIVDLFLTRFDPAITADRRFTREAGLVESITTSLDAIANADQDRILRRYLNAVTATLRTNFFQPGAEGTAKPYLALKLDSQALDDLPLPRPLVETFVYSPEMEGIHLRGGRVARGGIRWSDRQEDYRTEILGLMKAQNVKNAVIVPVGAKGGFVVRRPPDGGDRDAVLPAGTRCYRRLIEGLLDLTDNRSAGRVTPPADVVRHDDDDPYLVVAADKGTATFSDIANGIAVERRFWLGDAFASGGSRGYDHKGMGITARGAWECVKRHFREVGQDIQTTPFTVVGVGDMSGDVFGNGMLLSPHIHLLAAFDHRHIFIDPAPDPAVSSAERRRLFDLPRSSWDDYDRSCLSAGGGIFERRAKSITPGAEISSRFGITQPRLTPAELIRVLLKAQVDLLWFGGIGTYVKASHEGNADVGDRANDTNRVNASELRCKVIGEGANLAVTQLGRVEAALGGVRLNADFIDNSAGVDCSDHEVNIKILLDHLVDDGDLTDKQRNALLVEMTDDVAALVLRDNYQQSQAISLIEADGAAGLDAHQRLMRTLERRGRLDRALEFLPDDEALAERAAAGKGLTRPEIAVLLSYAKIWLNDEILASSLPDERYMAEDLVHYFPGRLREPFGAAIARHRLRRELIATAITNSLVNRVGATFLDDMMQKTGAPLEDIARAFIITRESFDLRSIWSDIEALDGTVAPVTQVTLHREVRRLIERAALWYLRNGGNPLDVAVNVAAFEQPVRALASGIHTLVPEDVDGRIRHRAGRYRELGVPEATALRIAYLILLPSAPDIVRIAAARGIDWRRVAGHYFALGDAFGVGWLRYQAEKIPQQDHWQRLAAAAFVEELYSYQRDLTVRTVADGSDVTAPGDVLCQLRPDACRRMTGLLADLQQAPAVDFAMLAVAIRHLRSLVES